MRLAIVAAEKALYPVRLLCRCLEVSRSGFYAWLRGRPASMRARADAQLSVEIAASHAESRKTYGSLRSLRDLRDSGRKVSRKRVARLMRHQGLAGCRRRRSQRTTDSNHPFRVAPNVLMREFQVEAPNVAWATDRTYVWTQEGWRYLAVILDLFSRRVVGFSMSDRITRQLALDALREALVHRPGIVDLIHHSDRGSQLGFKAPFAPHGGARGERSAPSAVALGLVAGGASPTASSVGAVGPCRRRARSVDLAVALHDVAGVVQCSDDGVHRDLLVVERHRDSVGIHVRLDGRDALDLLDGRTGRRSSTASDDARRLEHIGDRRGLGGRDRQQERKDRQYGFQLVGHGDASSSFLYGAQTDKSSAKRVRFPAPTPLSHSRSAT